VVDLPPDFQARIPRVLVDRIDRLIERSDEGITSRNNFVAEAVREKLALMEERVIRRTAFESWMKDMDKGSALASARLWVAANSPRRGPA
jgi:hypothetical protein